MRPRSLIKGSIIGLAVAGLFCAYSSWSAASHQVGTVYRTGDPQVKKVALTFDDGPNEPYTSQILKILQENNVRATFFMMGENVEAFPEAARAVLRAGHAIGNHSYDHYRQFPDTDAVMRDEILKTEGIIQRVTGQKTMLYRPPYGSMDPLMVDQARKQGYVIVLWSAWGKDWLKPGVPQILDNILPDVHNGAIILLHDGYKWFHGADRSQTVATLPILITRLRKQGYEFVTVPELLKLSNP